MKVLTILLFAGALCYAGQGDAIQSDAARLSPAEKGRRSRQVLGRCSVGKDLTIATVARRYDFLFDGRTITRARGNPLGDRDSIEDDAPMTLFRAPR